MPICLSLSVYRKKRISAANIFRFSEDFKHLSWLHSEISLQNAVTRIQLLDRAYRILAKFSYSEKKKYLELEDILLLVSELH